VAYFKLCSRMFPGEFVEHHEKLMLAYHQLGFEHGTSRSRVRPPLCMPGVGMDTWTKRWKAGRMG
jgi:hypothetical protein